MECVDGTSFQILLSLSCFEFGWENVSLLPGFCGQNTHRPNLEGLRGPKGGGQNRHGYLFPDTNALFIRAADVCHMGFKQPVLQRRLLGPHRPPCRGLSGMSAKFKSPLGSSCVSTFGRGEVLAPAEGLLELVRETAACGGQMIGQSAAELRG